MQLNAFFPSLDIGSDPAKIRDWAQAAEDLGYAYIEVPDHVFGATARDGWVPLYGEKESFHETFVTLGFLAAVTKSIGLSSGVLIAPQRQTARNQPVDTTDFPAMRADRGGPKWREKPVDAFQRTSTDKSQGAGQMMRQFLKRAQQFAWYLHAIRRAGQVQKSSINV